MDLPPDQTQTGYSSTPNKEVAASRGGGHLMGVSPPTGHTLGDSSIVRIEEEPASCAGSQAEKPYSCIQCGKAFDDKLDLQTHLKTHTGQKAFPCAECGRGFTMKSYFDKHKMDKKEKPYLCSKCKTHFHQQCSYFQHKNSHEQGTLYSCPGCGERFRMKSELQSHQKMHAEEMMYSCPECGKCFQRKSSLVTHERIHGREKTQTNVAKIQEPKAGHSETNTARGSSCEKRSLQNTEIYPEPTPQENTSTHIMEQPASCEEHLKDISTPTDHTRIEYQTVIIKEETAKCEEHLKDISTPTEHTKMEYQTFTIKEETAKCEEHLKDISTPTDHTKMEYQTVIIKEEPSCVHHGSSCEKRSLRNTEIYPEPTPQENTSTHIMEQPASCEEHLKDIFTPTDHTKMRYQTVIIKEETAKCEEHLKHISTPTYHTKMEYQTVIVEKEPASCEHNPTELNKLSEDSFPVIKEETNLWKEQNIPNISTPTGQCETKYSSAVIKEKPVSCKGDLMDTDPTTEHKPSEYPAPHNGDKPTSHEEHLMVVYPHTEDEYTTICNKEEPASGGEGSRQAMDSPPDQTQTGYSSTPNKEVAASRGGGHLMGVSPPIGHTLGDSSIVCTEEEPASCAGSQAEETYSCIQCGKGFDDKPGLQSHLKTHTGQKAFPCAECGRGFTMKSYFDKHKMDRKEKPYLCSKCKTHFHQQCSYFQHKNSHEQGTLYSCPECGERFRMKSELHSHQKMHAEEMMYSCPECGKCFQRKSSLVTHERIHGREKTQTNVAKIQEPKAGHIEPNTARGSSCEKRSLQNTEIYPEPTPRENTSTHIMEQPASCEEHLKDISTSTEHTKMEYQTVIIKEETAKCEEHLKDISTPTDHTKMRYQTVTIKAETAKCEEHLKHISTPTDHTKMDYQTVTIKEETAKCEEHIKDISTPTDHTEMRYQTVIIKEEPASREGNFAGKHKPAEDSSLNTKKEPNTCEEQNIPDISTPTEQTQNQCLSPLFKGNSSFVEEGELLDICTFTEHTPTEYPPTHNEEAPTSLDGGSAMQVHQTTGHAVGDSTVIHIEEPASCDDSLNEEPYSCIQCGKCFNDKPCLQSHLKTHTGQKAFPCAQCGKGFTTKSYFNKHKKTHRKKKPYFCSKCGKHFRQQCAFLQHKNGHIGEKVYSCSLCGKHFNKKSALRSHQKTHPGEKLYPCSECEKAFQYKSSLVTHERIHMREKMQVNVDQIQEPKESLSEAGTTRGSSCEKRNLRNTETYSESTPREDTSTHIMAQPGPCEEHLKDVSTSTNHTKIECQSGITEELATGEGGDLMDTSPPTGHTLGEFSMARFEEEPASCDKSPVKKPYACIQCGKGFDQKPCLQSHLKTHTGQKAFPCAECGKGFTTKSYFNKHKMDGKENPYFCSKCGKQFGQQCAFLQHKSSHVGEKLFACPECGERFHSKSVLAAHRNTHTGVKLYICSECGKRFNQKSELGIHQTIHTGEKSYACSECGKCYLYKSSLVKHERIHVREKILSKIHTEEKA